MSHETTWLRRRESTDFDKSWGSVAWLGFCCVIA